MHHVINFEHGFNNLSNRRVSNFFSLIILPAIEYIEFDGNACANLSMYIVCSNGELDQNTTPPNNGFLLASWLIQSRQFHRLVWLRKLKLKNLILMFYNQFNIQIYSRITILSPQIYKIQNLIIGANDTLHSK